MTTYEQGEDMKRVYIVAGLSVLLLAGVNCTFADENVVPASDTQVTKVIKEDYTPQLLTKIKGQREVIYNSLGLTREQIKRIDELEVKRYAELEPLLKKLCYAKSNEKKVLANSSATEKEIKSAKKELNAVRCEIKKVSKRYDCELKKILTHDQWTKYLIIRKLKQKDLNNMNREKGATSPHKKSDLRPFGVPISQADYAQNLKKERCLFGKKGAEKVEK